MQVSCYCVFLRILLATHFLTYSGFLELIIMIPSLRIHLCMKTGKVEISAFLQTFCLTPAIGWFDVTKEAIFFFSSSTTALSQIRVRQHML